MVDARSEGFSATPRCSVWEAALVGACAGGMGWGIRGQYGHETGAMIAGLLVSLVLVLRVCPGISGSRAAVAVAWCTVAIGFGGSMSYGQTVGLTHNPNMVGNWGALGWGMLGLAIKGGIWIGFAGVFLGMGLGGRRYDGREVLGMFGGMLALFLLGTWWLNSPYDPAARILPRIYFSADWRWDPGAGDALRPRREVWGGLLLAWVGLWSYAGFVRGDVLARRLGLWAILGGALGFPAGQSLQAYHAWNLEWFRTGWLRELDPILNWWNFMETTFGAVFGALLGVGLWRNRGLVEDRRGEGRDSGPISATGIGWGWGLVGVHGLLVVISEFELVPGFGFYTDWSLVLGLIPAVGIAAGGWWPFILMFPITALPIAGKTIRSLVYEVRAVSEPVGWVVYGLVPLALTVLLAVGCARRAEGRADAYLPEAVLGATWLYFLLNYGFFRWPWPWVEWTSRTPNALVFIGCALVLTWAALRGRRAIEGKV